MNGNRSLSRSAGESVDAMMERGKGSGAKLSAAMIAVDGGTLSVPLGSRDLHNASARHGQGLGRMLLAQALRDCHDAGRTFAFVAVLLDCVDDEAKSFYQHFGFAEMPGRPYRLFLTTAKLEQILAGS